MTKIEQWVDSGMPYNEGVALYATLPGCNFSLLKNFQKKHSVPFHDKLKYELSKLGKVNISSPVAKPVDPDPKPKKTEIQKESDSLYFHQLPEELRPVLQMANNLFREMCLLKVQLNELPAHREKEALTIQLQIFQKQKQNTVCWKKIDYWQTHKVIAQEAASDFSKLSSAKLLQKEQYLFVAKSKLQKRLTDNINLLTSITDLSKKNKIERKISKQKENIIQKEQHLIEIKNIIDGK